MSRFRVLNSTPRKNSLKAFAFFLIGALLIAEYALIKHAIEHSFADTDEVCFVCEKADNFQNTLTASIGLVNVTQTPGYEAQPVFKTRLCGFRSLFQARAPPASSQL